MYEYEIRNGVPETHLLMLTGTKNDLFDYLNTEYRNAKTGRVLNISTRKVQRRRNRSRS